jgi:hypothetical protein
LIVIPPYYKNGTMMELLKAMQEKMDANLKEIKEDIKTNQEEMMAKMETHQERMMAKMDSQLNKMEACLGKMEATDREANPEEMKSIVVYEVSEEEAAVEMIGALKDQHLAVRCHGQLKKWTKGSGWTWKMLAAACREMTCPAIPAWSKGHGHQGPCRDNVARGSP